MFKKFLMAFFSWVVFSPAFAALTFTLTENGGNVVLTASGSLNTAALTAGVTSTCGSGTSGIQAGTGTLCVGAGSAVAHTVITGPTNFGAGGAVLGSTTSGDSVFLVGGAGAVYLPVGYTSGSPLAGTTTFNSTTLTALGVTPGTYTWTYGSGASADTIVLNAGSVASVPTLGEYALMALAGLLMLSTLPALRRRG